MDAYCYDREANKVYGEEIEVSQPRICAHCMRTGIQEFMCAYFSEKAVKLKNNLWQDEVSVVTACSYCSRITVNYYVRYDSDPEYLCDVEFKHSYTTPYIATEMDLTEYRIGDDLKSKFPEFINILEQAMEAESFGLDKLAGMGYRKALEFLVTDYLISENLEKASKEWLENPGVQLSQKIMHLPNERMITLARAISFIGNDETHYTRRHPEHDTESIKIFLRAMISDLENELIFKDAQKLIDKVDKAKRQPS